MSSRAVGTLVPGDPQVRRRIRVGAVAGNGTFVMLAGTVVSLLGAYLFQVGGGRILGPVDFAPVTVLWTVQFLIMTVVMIPIEQLVIRRMTLSAGRTASLRSSALPLLVLLLGASAVAGSIAAALLRQSFAGDVRFVFLTVGLVATYSVFAVARGYLAGRGQYHRYGIATAAESVGRLLLAGAVLLVTTDTAAIGLVLVLAPLAVLVVRPFTALRGRAAAGSGPGAPESTEDALVGGAGRFLMPLVLANGASQTMLGAGPVIVVALGASPTTVSIVFLTFTLFRAPSWVLQSALSRVLPPFTALASTPAALRRWALLLAGAGVTLSLLGGPVGWWMGPEVVGLLVGPEFAPSAPLAGLVAAGTVLAASTLFSGQILIAVGRTDRLAVAWLIGLAAAAVALTLREPAELRVAMAFLIGEMVALVAVSAFAITATADGERVSRP